MAPGAALLLGACGGGGGGDGGGLSLRLSPPSISGTFFEGEARTFVVTGSVSGSVNGAVNVVIVDSVGVIQPDVSIQRVGDDYEATFTTATTLAVGSHRGTISVQLCGGIPPACSPRYASRNLPYDFTVEARPAPAIGGLDPSQSTAGIGTFTLRVSGSNFFPNSVVVFDGTPLVTWYSSPTELLAVVTGSVNAEGGNRPVTVVTGSATSAPVNHLVINPAPSLAAVSPASTAVGCGDFTLTAAGSGFVQSSVVSWQGEPLATTLVSGARLQAVVPPGLITGAGEFAVTVDTPGPGGGSTTGRAVIVAASPAPASQAVAYQVTPGHTGVASSRCPQSLADTPLWDVDVGGVPSYALVADGKVFVTYQRPFIPDATSQLVAFDQRTGAVAWGPVLVAGQGNILSAVNAAYADGKVFLVSSLDAGLPYDFVSGTYPPSVQARDAATGALLWRRRLNDGGRISRISAPTAANGRVYVSYSNLGADAFIRAFSQADGAIAWTAFGENGGSPPAVTTEGVYVSEGCTTRGLDAATGTDLWSRNSGCSSGSSGAPIVTGGRVHAPVPNFSGPGSPVYDASTGDEAGTFPYARMSPIAGGTVYAVTGPGTLRAATLATGAVQWEVPQSIPQFGRIDVSPILVDDRVITGNTSGLLWALDSATGTVVWQVNVGGSLPLAIETVSSPLRGLAAGDNLLVVPVGNRLRAYRTGN